MIQFGMIAGIKIQSISDIITNSSTEVYTIYSIRDKQTIKDIVNAILGVGSDLRFDDVFDIGMLVSEYASEDLWDNSPELQEKFPTLNDFDDHLSELSDDELAVYADKWDDLYGWDDCRPFFDGYYVTFKEGVEHTPALERACKAINRLDSIFTHDAIFS